MHTPPALRHFDFRVFWTGQALSAFGSQFTTVGMAWQMYELTNSPLQIGLLGLARAIPQMALLLFGGLLADAVDRRRLLMVVQVLQLLVSAGLWVCTAANAMRPEILLGAAGLFAVCTGLGQPARQAYVPNLVAREDLASALAFNGTAMQVANIAGPATGGIVLAAAGAAACYAIDAVSWLAMLAALMAIRARRMEPARGRVTFTALAEGITFLRGQPVLIAMMALDCGATFFGNPRALLPIFARDLYHVGAPGLGLLFGATSAGAFAAAIPLGVRGQPRHAVRWVLLGLVVYGCCTMGFAASPRLPFGFWFGVLCLAGTGAGNTLNNVLRNTINQLLTPDELRGRVSAASTVFTSGGPQLGQLESGLTAEWWGTEPAAFVGGLATVAFVGLVAFVPGLWSFRVLPSERVAAPA